ncbi:hypothetical protein D3C71_1308860 [compost metagenome]
MNSPELLPSNLATELPWALSASAPSIWPRLFSISATLGNSADSLSPATVPRISPASGFLLLSSTTTVLNLPLATSKRSGSRRSTPFFSWACVLSASIGSWSELTMCLPSNLRSRSIAFQRPMSKVSSGKILPPVALARSALASEVPSTGTRSARRSCSERILPSRRGRGLAEV